MIHCCQSLFLGKSAVNSDVQHFDLLHSKQFISPNYSHFHHTDWCMCVFSETGADVRSLPWYPGFLNLWRNKSETSHSSRCKWRSERFFGYKLFSLFSSPRSHAEVRSLLRSLILCLSGTGTASMYMYFLYQVKATVHVTDVTDVTCEHVAAVTLAYC